MMPIFPKKPLDEAAFVPDDVDYDRDLASSPWCECDLPGPDEEEQASNTCKACGKVIS